MQYYLTDVTSFQANITVRCGLITVTYSPPHLLNNSIGKNFLSFFSLSFLRIRAIERLTPGPLLRLAQVKFHNMKTLYSQLWFFPSSLGSLLFHSVSCFYTQACDESKFLLPKLPLSFSHLSSTKIRFSTLLSAI